MKMLLFVGLTLAMVFPMTGPGDRGSAARSRRSHTPTNTLDRLTTEEVSRAEEPLKVRKGDSVHLNVSGYKPHRYHKFYWKCNDSRILEWKFGGEPKTEEPYKLRVDFDEMNYSLQLKNVQQNDSGIYTAVCFHEDGEREIVSSYELIVEDSQGESRKGNQSSTNGSNIISKCSGGSQPPAMTYSECARAEVPSADSQRHTGRLIERFIRTWPSKLTAMKADPLSN
ncbi:hypothetical protein GJAV_G00094080 [Gymnothorax javanicus]|nr:hypothetical protein GJAV_G00094080 [Gymnothorax javanicus]